MTLLISIIITTTIYNIFLLLQFSMVQIKWISCGEKNRITILLHFCLVGFFFSSPLVRYFSSNSMSIIFPWTLAVTASRELHVVSANCNVLWTGCQEQWESGKRCRALAICAVGSRSCRFHLLFLFMIVLYIQDWELLPLANSPVHDLVISNC